VQNLQENNLVSALFSEEGHDRDNQSQNIILCPQEVFSGVGLYQNGQNKV
jgi:hypothetical protein